MWHRLQVVLMLGPLLAKQWSNPKSLRLMETDGRFSVMTWGLSITLTQ
jgi:hypothetical protein